MKRKQKFSRPIWVLRMVFLHPSITSHLLLTGYALWARFMGTTQEKLIAGALLMGWLTVGLLLTVRLTLQKNADGKTYRVRDFWFYNN